MPEYPQIDTIDGLSIRFEEGTRILIRASNTGPKIRITAESKNRTDLE